MMYGGEVVGGKGRGTRIGFPTLNFKIPEPFPYRYGIYAGWVVAGADRYRAVFHYGPIPTFHEETLSLEAFLLGGATLQKSSAISFELTAYLREVKMFGSTDELAEQIRRDAEDAGKILDS